ncbi:MAG: hypothetical protein ACLFST_02095 [Spirochaetia bacterium]
MKKFIISLIILIILGGVVFYFGWVQITVPPNHYGVIFTKTRGWDGDLVVPGDFRWEIERLLPTNFKLYLFHLSPEEVRIRTEGSLPSADFYASVLPEKAEFKYNIDLFITIKVRPDHLVSLVKDESLRPDTIDKWYTDISRRMELETIAIIADVLGKPDRDVILEESGNDPMMIYSGMEEDIIFRIEQKFPFLKVISVAPIEFQLPDPELYRTARSTYLEMVRTETRAKSESKAAEIRENIITGGTLDTLSRYGQILTDHPVLLDYLNLIIESGSDPLGINKNFSNPEE